MPRGQPGPFDSRQRPAHLAVCQGLADRPDTGDRLVSLSTLSGPRVSSLDLPDFGVAYFENFGSVVRKALLSLSKRFCSSLRVVMVLICAKIYAQIFNKHRQTGQVARSLGVESAIGTSFTIAPPPNSLAAPFCPSEPHEFLSST
ncbi:unnamed protein product [Protopolystoma xenopodis]|uniref:Uncharacterized protein n=1 Tax=Protopolystoma xenopodis TaxID=117903 RepID=A0A448XCJ0_9PLAT|nr:unnamed protein product [Protopolystoma xenopodis]